MHRVAWWVIWIVGSVVAFPVGLIGTFIVLEVAVDAAGGDPATAFDGKLAFGFSLTTAFAVGAALVALLQWGLLRSVAGSRAWLWALPSGFALAAAIYATSYALFDETQGLLRLFDEVVHNAVGGAVAGWIVAGRVATPRGRGAFAALVGLAMVSAGLSAWAVEAALSWESGAAAPFGIAVLATILGLGWRPMVRSAPPQAQASAARPA